MPKGYPNHIEDFSYSVVSGRLYCKNVRAAEFAIRGAKGVTIDGKTVYVHRLVWYLVTGR